MLKHVLRRLIGPKIWRTIKAITGRSNLEEVDLIYELLRFEKGSKTLIDVGAHHGSSLEKFAEDGWNVCAFEPDPENRKILAKLCKKYPNVDIDPRAVSDKNKERLPFYTSYVSTGISSLSAFHKTHRESAVVETVTLNAYLKERSIPCVDFLKIDTEGHDLFVLKGLSWEDTLTAVILCEFEDRKTTPLGYDFHELAIYLTSKGYTILVSEWHPLTEYGRKHRWRKFLTYPCELSAPDAWGNIIAIKNADQYARLVTIAERYSKKFS